MDAQHIEILFGYSCNHLMSCIDTLVLSFYIGKCNCDKVSNIKSGSRVGKKNIIFYCHMVLGTWF